jgi:peptidoglycan/LPS O-acetylase OafA/YrhL
MDSGASTSSRFDLLDAARGLAALGVVFAHVAELPVNSLARNVEHAQTPTDLGVGLPSVAVFFVISGYCIAAAAEAALRRGRSFGWFMRRRMHRIWPPYLFSVGVWAATRALKTLIGGANDLRASPVVWAQNLTLTQWLSDFAPLTHGKPPLFSPVYWSLCYEEQFYLVMALAIAAGRRTALSTGVAALAVAGLAWNVVDLGGSFFLNLWPMFALGALVYYTLSGRAQTRWVRAFWAVAIVATLVIAWERRPCPNVRHSLIWAGMIHLDPVPSLVALVFAGLLVGLRPYDGVLMRSRVGSMLRRLGAVSFSLYLVHFPLFSIVQVSVGKVTHWALPRQVFWTAQAAAHVMIASVFWYFCERPFLNSPDLAAKAPVGAPEAAPALPPIA